MLSSKDYLLENTSKVKYFKMPGTTQRLLTIAPYHTMCTEFKEFRMDSFLRFLDKTKAKGRVLPFVRGLRLSAHLIYTLRDFLKGSNLTADWGHLLVDEGEICSVECDIIIHKKCKSYKWNGHKKSIMDFRFVPQEYAVAVISCKSYIRSTDIEVAYFNDLNKYIDKIWLFAECCGPRSYESIRKKAIEIGYENFWSLYTYSSKGRINMKEEIWLDFVSQIDALKTQFR